jgi:hypothetical protein
MVVVQLCFVRLCKDKHNLCRLQESQSKYFVTINQDDPKRSLMLHAYEWIKENGLTGAETCKIFLYQNELKIQIFKVNSAKCRFYWFVNEKQAHTLQKTVLKTWKFVDITVNPIDASDGQLLTAIEEDKERIYNNIIRAGGLTSGVILAGSSAFIYHKIQQDAQKVSRMTTRKREEYADNVNRRTRLDEHTKKIHASIRLSDLQKKQAKETYEDWLMVKCKKFTKSLSYANFIKNCTSAFGKHPVEFMGRYKMFDKYVKPTNDEKQRFILGCYLFCKLFESDDIVEVTQGSHTFDVVSGRDLSIWQPDRFSEGCLLETQKSDVEDDFRDSFPEWFGLDGHKQMEVLEMKMLGKILATSKLGDNPPGKRYKKIQDWIFLKKADMQPKIMHLYYMISGSDFTTMSSILFCSMSKLAIDNVLLDNHKTTVIAFKFFCNKLRDLRYFQKELRVNLKYDRNTALNWLYANRNDPKAQTIYKKMIAKFPLTRADYLTSRTMQREWINNKCIEFVRQMDSSDFVRQCIVVFKQSSIDIMQAYNFPTDTVEDRKLYITGASLIKHYFLDKIDGVGVFDKRDFSVWQPDQIKSDCLDVNILSSIQTDFFKDFPGYQSMSIDDIHTLIAKVAGTNQHIVRWIKADTPILRDLLYRFSMLFAMTSESDSVIRDVLLCTMSKTAFDRVISESPVDQDAFSSFCKKVRSRRYFRDKLRKTLKTLKTQELAQSTSESNE